MDRAEEVRFPNEGIPITQPLFTFVKEFKRALHSIISRACDRHILHRVQGYRTTLTNSAATQVVRQISSVFALRLSV